MCGKLRVLNTQEIQIFLLSFQISFSRSSITWTIQILLSCNNVYNSVIAHKTFQNASTSMCLPSAQMWILELKDTVLLHSHSPQFLVPNRSLMKVWWSNISLDVTNLNLKTDYQVFQLNRLSFAATDSPRILHICPHGLTLIQIF